MVVGFLGRQFLDGFVLGFQSRAFLRGFGLSVIFLPRLSMVCLAVARSAESWVKSVLSLAMASSSAAVLGGLALDLKSGNQLAEKFLKILCHILWRRVNGEQAGRIRGGCVNEINRIQLVASGERHPVDLFVLAAEGNRKAESLRLVGWKAQQSAGRDHGF
jgi:hypothetical protein